jgi:polyisoprenoid-binding protein YceI
MTSTLRRSIALGALLAVAAASPLMAQPKMPTPVKDFKAAGAGNYVLDESHTGVVARASHVGFSYEVLRFTRVAGTLTWDPANPAADVLNVSVDPKSITTAPTGAVDFAAELAGPKFLNVAQFPNTTFVSHAFHVIDASHGKVEGDLTIMGVTKPAVFDVELVGAGKGFTGADTLGVTATTWIHPDAFGLQPAMLFSAPMELKIDAEFDRKG